MTETARDNLDGHRYFTPEELMYWVEAADTEADPETLRAALQSAARTALALNVTDRATLPGVIAAARSVLHHLHTDRHEMPDEAVNWADLGVTEILAAPDRWICRIEEVSPAAETFKREFEFRMAEEWGHTVEAWLEW